MLQKPQKGLCHFLIIILAKYQYSLEIHIEVPTKIRLGLAKK